jgi:hypothetical protein
MQFAWTKISFTYDPLYYCNFYLGYKQLIKNELHLIISYHFCFYKEIKGMLIIKLVYSIPLIRVIIWM